MLLDFFGLTQDVTYNGDSQTWLGHGHNYQAKILSLEVEGYEPLFFFCFYDAASIFGNYGSNNPTRYEFVYKNDTLHAAACLPRLRGGVPKATKLFKGEPSAFIESSQKIAQELKGYRGNGFYGFISLLEGQYASNGTLQILEAVPPDATVIREWSINVGKISYIRRQGNGFFILTNFNKNALKEKVIITGDPSKVLTGDYELTDPMSSIFAPLFKASEIAYYEEVNVSQHYFNYDEDNQILSFLDSGYLWIFKIKLEVGEFPELDIGTVMGLELLPNSYTASKEELEEFENIVRVMRTFW